MPRTYELKLTFGELETLHEILDEQRETYKRMLDNEKTHESLKDTYKLALERIEGVLDQF